MSDHGLTKENLLRSLPISLSGDPKMAALAEAISGVLARRWGEVARLSIYPHVDSLDEGLLDILAYDFKVDWWDSDYTLEEKRRTLASSWQVHKTLGTKAAVEQALRAIFPRTTVKEWFEYGGRPYHFRLDINITEDEADSAKQKRVLERLRYYKNLRSHLDGVTYFLESHAPAYAGAVFLGSFRRISGAVIEPGARWPQVDTGLHAGGRYLGQSRWAAGSIENINMGWPQGEAAYGVGIGKTGVYQRIVVNQKGGMQNGTLE